MGIDFGKTADDYERHRAGFPPVLFERLLAHGIGIDGQRVLDLGTGTGSLGRGFAARGCAVTGLDPSPELIAKARALDAAAGVSTRYVVAKAEATGLPAASFDVVTAGQCWHWFDRPAAAAEATRLLAPSGVLLITHFDWIPLPGNVVDETERLIERHNPAWKFGGGTGVYPRWFTDLGIAGFGGIESLSFDLPASYSHNDWRGRVRASAGVGASLPPDKVAAFDTALAAMLKEHFADEPLAVPHRVFAVWGRKRE